MKICYIISTCDKYLTTRVQWQFNTFLKYVPREDVYYLTSQMDEDNRFFGFGAQDDYYSIPLKYIYFLQNMNIEDKYDWFVLPDDDTFVFHNRLESLLSSYDPNQNIYLGKGLDHIQRDWCYYHSGGAGYVFSRSMFKLVTQYTRQTPMEKLYMHYSDDLCIGMWIVQITKEHKVQTINNDDFHMFNYQNMHDLQTAITFHQVREESQYKFYGDYMDFEIFSQIDPTERYNFLKTHYNENKICCCSENSTDNTVFVTLTDSNYIHKATRTISQLRTVGEWHGDLVVITVGFGLNKDFKKEFNIIEKQFPQIDKSELLEKIGQGFSDSDGRELTKTTQWEKLHLFDEYFSQWSRVVFVDAGLYILDSVHYLLELDCTDKFMSPNDQGDGEIKHNNNLFDCQITVDRPEIKKQMVEDFSCYSSNILNSEYFLNCIWMYDTKILEIVKKQELIDNMNKYPIFRTNEMGLMNLVINYKYDLWKKFPEKISNGKFLFDWCEINRKNTKLSDYVFIKYPVINRMTNEPANW